MVMFNSIMFLLARRLFPAITRPGNVVARGQGGDPPPSARLNNVVTPSNTATSYHQREICREGSIWEKHYHLIESLFPR